MEQPVQIVQIHDGDTVTLSTGEKLRLYGIDAPEMRGSPRCEPKRRRQLATSRNPAWCDHALAVRSRDALRAFVMRGRVKVIRTGDYSYGRSVARVTVNGVDAGSFMVSRGFARWWKRP